MLCAGCDPVAEYAVFTGPTMGTHYRIQARCPAADPAAIASLIEAELRAVNAQMSSYDENSEVSRFNQATASEWMPVSEDLVTVVAVAESISQLSGGAFDVTIAPLVDLWGFGPASGISRPPTPEAVAATRGRVGYPHLAYRSAPAGLSKTRDLKLDLSAIAKGHGVDRISGLLDQMGCHDHLTDIGGEVRGRGLNPRGHPWRVGIEVPQAGAAAAVQRVIILRDRAVATSGDYRNYIDFDGQRFSHTIDPRTGYPVQHLLASVSVVHDSAMWADGLATALNVLGPEQGLDLAEREGLAALFLIRSASGFQERYTSSMENYLVAEQSPFDADGNADRSGAGS